MLQSAIRAFRSGSWLPPISLKVIILCLCWYAVSSVTTTFNKAILDVFSYPALLTEIQFLSNVILGIAVIELATWLPQIRRWFPEGSVPRIGRLQSPSRSMLRKTVPMGIFQFAGHLLSHAATSIIPAAAVASIKALSPIVTVAVYRIVFQTRMPIATYASLIPLVSGIMMILMRGSLYSVISGQFRGVFFAVLSTFVFVAQSIYSKTLLSGTNDKQRAETDLPLTELRHNRSNSFSDKMTGTASRILTEAASGKPDKLTVLIYCSLWGFFFSLPVFLGTELSPILSVVSGNSASASASVADFVNSVESSKTTTIIQSVPWLYLLGNGTSHFIQALLAFHIIGVLSPVSYSIASLLKRIVVITVTMIWAGHSIHKSQVCGLILTGVGLYCYDRFSSGHGKH